MDIINITGLYMTKSTVKVGFANSQTMENFSSLEFATSLYSEDSTQEKFPLLQTTGECSFSFLKLLFSSFHLVFYVN